MCIELSQGATRAPDVNHLSDRETANGGVVEAAGVGGAIGATALQDAAAKLEATLMEEPKDLPKKLLSATEKELDLIISLLGNRS